MMDLLCTALKEQSKQLAANRNSRKKNNETKMKTNNVVVKNHCGTTLFQKEPPFVFQLMEEFVIIQLLLYCLVSILDVIGISIQVSKGNKNFSCIVLLCVLFTFNLTNALGSLILSYDRFNDFCVFQAYLLAFISYSLFGAMFFLAFRLWRNLTVIRHDNQASKVEIIAMLISVIIFPAVAMVCQVDPSRFTVVPSLGLVCISTASFWGNVAASLIRLLLSAGCAVMTGMVSYGIYKHTSANAYEQNIETRNRIIKLCIGFNIFTFPISVWFCYYACRFFFSPEEPSEEVVYTMPTSKFVDIDDPAFNDSQSVTFRMFLIQVAFISASVIVFSVFSTTANGKEFFKEKASSLRSSLSGMKQKVGGAVSGKKSSEKSRQARIASTKVLEGVAVMSSTGYPSSTGYTSTNGGSTAGASTIGQNDPMPYSNKANTDTIYALESSTASLFHGNDIGDSTHSLIHE
jgi:hypothetical protein